MSNKTQRGGAKLTASGKRLRVRTAERRSTYHRDKLET